jgi:hypothetical protein
MSVTFGAFTPSTLAAINQSIRESVTISGNSYYLDPANGQDTNTGTSPDQAVQSLAQAYALCTAGHNDVVYLLGNGTTTATARLTATFTWAKNATHLIGVSSGVNLSNRSRIAPTSTATSFTPFFSVTASGCYFGNIQFYAGFTTGAATSIGMAITGGRNKFENCDIIGMADAASAQSAGSRTLTIATLGENQFIRCTLGTDTVTRTQANATIEFLGVGNPRNEFVDCVFPFQGSSSGVLGIKVAAAAASDRFQLFKNCLFMNNIKSTSTQMSALCTLAASIGGAMVFVNPVLFGITTFGTDATSNAQIYIASPVFSNVAGGAGIAVVPA